MSRQLPQSLHYCAELPFLAGCGANRYSQFGEDGLIAATFAAIGIKNQWCFEIGAADGYFYSNSLQWRESGWNAVLIESSDTEFEKLKDYESKQCICIHETCSNLDDTLASTPIPAEPDLGIIDIDGQDYWLWHDLKDYTPRVMLVEFHWSMGHDYIPPRGGEYRQQAGETSLRRLAADKGYTVVAKTHVNLLCVRSECL
jgi:hypothetical protein